MSKQTPVVVPSGAAVATVEDAHQILSGHATVVVSDLLSLLQHPVTVIQKFALYELKNRGKI